MMQQTAHQNWSNECQSNNTFTHKQSLSDGALEDCTVEIDRDKQMQIPCTITSCENGITIAVEGYEDNMSVHFEYYNGNLQVFIWGEESLEREGDCALKYIITDKYSDFRHRIDALYRE
ncbi:MAG: hypothetical protein N4J56_007394 [Chroococcidiopsis sp. SAG 2025]|uniref:hypothetical protein n=1 Tax=Chroococcidiopsis sp. SAG 2025 TaxID=171389 RepID=UPI0029371ABB|nr:hypothetical protein [Chroococcidiopsis sp. SAG 2025]MDV2997689.1 hypothetical protein [Chroococcidiopsis sp. SAG 2025]